MDCFGDLPGDGVVVSPPSPIVERLNLSPQQSPAVGTGSKGDARPRAGIQSTEREGVFPLQSSLDGYTNPDQEWTTNLLQADVGVKEKISIKQYYVNLVIVSINMYQSQELVVIL